MLIATHAGQFHADDVVAVALVRLFAHPSANVVRTRNPAVIASADMVVDVGGVFDPSSKKFDHHQADYHGERSSAGMILDWLGDKGSISGRLFRHLHDNLIHQVDQVDIGKAEIRPGEMTFSDTIAHFNPASKDPAVQLEAFEAAVNVATTVIQSLTNKLQSILDDEDTVLDAMELAERNGDKTMWFPGELVWKETYFENGGSTHHTRYIASPVNGQWRLLAIPPRMNTFDMKSPLPHRWHTHTKEIPGLVFCHKTGFLAVFNTEKDLRAALATL